MVTFVFTTLFPSTAIVRERELGTIEQLIITPIRPIELIVAKVIPYVLVSFIVVIEVLVVGVLLFGVPINGSVPLLLGLSALFLITALGLGILISTVASTQQEALLMTLATSLPTVYLSGFLFPIEAMPGGCKPHLRKKRRPGPLRHHYCPGHYPERGGPAHPHRAGGGGAGVQRGGDDPGRHPV
jgi:ABC-type multidrug transport system permease subunit